MSWDAYANNIKERGLASGAIVGKDGSVWAKTADFKATDAEIKLIANLTVNGGQPPASGLTIAGTKHQLLRAGEGILYSKEGQNGISAAAAGTCIVVGIYNSSQQPGAANNQTFALAEYLKNSGY